VAKVCPDRSPHSPGESLLLRPPPIFVVLALVIDGDLQRPSHFPIFFLSLFDCLNLPRALRHALFTKVPVSRCPPPILRPTPHIFLRRSALSQVFEDAYVATVRFSLASATDAFSLKCLCPGCICLLVLSVPVARFYLPPLQSLADRDRSFLLARS